MNGRRKYITLFIGLIVIFGGLLSYTASRNNSKKVNIPLQTGKDAITSRFPKLGNIKECYWKADVMGNPGNDRVPGPSSYWMKGFVKVGDEQIKEYIKLYEMKETEAKLGFDFTPPDFNADESVMYYSEKFDEYIKPPGFFGHFYIDSCNQYICFDVNK